MPKTKVERNRAYRQRLRAKARAWDHIDREFAKPRPEIPIHDLQQFSGKVWIVVLKTLREARDIAAEQANG